MSWNSQATGRTSIFLVSVSLLVSANGWGQEAISGSSFATPGVPAGVISPNPALHLGRWDFHAGVTATAAYDDLVGFDAAGNAQSDLTWTLSPWGSAEIQGPNGRVLRAFYQPSFLFFTDHSEFNTINHLGTFNINWPLNRLTLSLNENVGVSSYVVRDVAARSTYSAYTTTGMANYELSDLTFLSGSVTYQPSSYGGSYLSYDSYAELLSINYRVTPRFSLGLGVTTTQLVVENAPTQLSEGPTLLASYQFDPLLSIDATAGVVLQQFGSGTPTSLAEVFSIAGNYHVRPTTILALQAHRSEVPSGILVGQNYTETAFGASVQQMLPHKISGTLDVGYTSADYYAVEPGVSAQRTDNYFHVRLNLGLPLATHWSISVFYEHDGNLSNTSTFQYDRNTAGVQGSWAF